VKILLIKILKTYIIDLLIEKLTNEAEEAVDKVLAKAKAKVVDPDNSLTDDVVDILINNKGLLKDFAIEEIKEGMDRIKNKI